MPIKQKTYRDDEIHIQLYSRKDPQGTVFFDHAIINGVRYYPEDFKLDLLKNFEQLLVYQTLFGFEHVTP